MTADAPLSADDSLFQRARLIILEIPVWVSIGQISPNVSTQEIADTATRKAFETIAAWLKYDFMAGDRENAVEEIAHALKASLPDAERN